MRHLTRIIVIAALVILGCDKNKTDYTTFSNAQDADSVYSSDFQNNESGQNPALIGVQGAMTAAEIAAQFDGSTRFGFRTPWTGNTLSKTYGTNDLIYDFSTHFWILDSTFAFHEGGLEGSAHVVGQVRFTPRNAFGMPVEETNEMEYSVDVDGEASGDKDSATYNSHFNFATDFDITGIEKFKKDSGNLTINGSTSASITIDVTKHSQTVNIAYSTSHEVDHVVFRPHDEENSKYPLSGTIRFTVRHTTSLEGDGEVNVAGTITFDGDNTAIMVFGGVTFVLNLDTGQITLA